MGWQGAGGAIPCWPHWDLVTIYSIWFLFVAPVYDSDCIRLVLKAQTARSPGPGL